MSLILRTDKLGTPFYFGGVVRRSIGVGVVLVGNAIDAREVGASEMASIQSQFPAFDFKTRNSGLGGSNRDN